MPAKEVVNSGANKTNGVAVEPDTRSQVEVLRAIEERLKESSSLKRAALNAAAISTTAFTMGLLGMALAIKLGVVRVYTT